MGNIFHKIAARLSHRPDKNSVAILFLSLYFLALIFYAFLIRPPSDFPFHSLYSIKEGAALSETASDSKEKRVVRSQFLLKVLVILFSGNKGAISGDYVLDKKENLFKIALRFAGGDYRLSAVKITIPEGTSVFEISKILSKNGDLANFNPQDFIRLAIDKEGYLYPDTYYFLPNVRANQIIDTMEENFNKKIEPIRKDLKTFGKSMTEIITMASILEKEVPTTEDRKIVAGILWKRIKMGMPLQVDAAFPYITQRQDGRVTRDDLKIDSPYNTYLNKGLPPGPISNPSLDAIIAAISPTETKYFFYISDRKGITHFSVTLEDHNKNIDKYLK